MSTYRHFLRHVASTPPGKCWEWVGAAGGKGEHRYGVFQNTTAHRWNYARIHGDPGDLVVDHLCGNKMCVNPDHLEAVTQRENLLRSPNTLNSKNAAKTHCKDGHEFTEENTYISPTNGQRVCRTCRREWKRRADRQKKIAHRAN